MSKGIRYPLKQVIPLINIFFLNLKLLLLFNNIRRHKDQTHNILVEDIYLLMLIRIELNLKSKLV